MSLKKEIILGSKMGAGVMIMDLSASRFLEVFPSQNQEDLIRASIVGAIGATIFLKAIIDSTRNRSEDSKQSVFERMRREDVVVLEDFRRNKRSRAIESGQRKMQTG